jgi:UDP-N-acetylmuramate--alanine ligase
MHGKSTVTSLIAHIFEVADKDPTVFCGAVMNEYLCQYKFGGGEHFIFEACEYKDSFLSFCPTDSVILNIDFDHPDYFKSKEQILDSFRKYAKIGDRVFINADDELSNEAFKNENLPNLIAFGVEKNADYTARITEYGFVAYYKDKLLAECKVKQKGIHMIYNSLCALAVAVENGIAPRVAAYAISTFEGTDRRLQLIKKGGGRGDIYVDYAHHPREIRATLDALYKMGYKNILCVFQPHTYSRTASLYSEFISALKGAHRLIIAPIYAAREENIYGISSESLALDSHGEYIEDFNKIKEEILKSKNDAVVIMGAGDIIKLKNLLI